MPEIDLAYPIGRFELPSRLDAETRSVHIAELEAAPGVLRAAVDGFTESQLDTPYRPGGWTVRQVVHHLPDSHANAYVRFRLALTEDVPTIRPYDEALWAQLPDARTAPVELSLSLLACLHARWLACIRALPGDAFERTFVHPELGIMSLDHQLALYAWHGRHHVAHISALAIRMGWARIYHVVPETDFRTQLAGSAYVPAGLQGDGFVHCARGASVIAVANDYFAGVAGNLLLLEIDPARLAAETRYEEAAPLAGGGTSHLASESRFPHVYGPIDADAIIRVGLFGRTASGYEWPREFASLDTFVASGLPRFG